MIILHPICVPLSISVKNFTIALASFVNNCNIACMVFNSAGLRFFFVDFSIPRSAIFYFIHMGNTLVCAKKHAQLASAEIESHLIKNPGSRAGSLSSLLSRPASWSLLLSLLRNSIESVLGAIRDQYVLYFKAAPFLRPRGLDLVPCDDRMHHLSLSVSTFISLITALAADFSTGGAIS